MVRVINLGTKQPKSASKASLGTKVYGGIRSLGSKVYDNRYKIIGTAGSALGSATFNYLTGTSSPPANNLGQSVLTPPKPDLGFPSVPRGTNMYALD